MANNRIQIKRTSVSGRAANTTTLTNAGELALNMTDGIMYSTNGSVVFEIGANTTNSRVTNNLTVGGTVTATGIVSGSELTSTNASGDEGGQINLTKPPNGTLDGGITIDAYQNKIRIFEQGGSARGVYINLPDAAGGVGTNLLATGGSGSVNVSAQYAWTNTHSFSANVAFTGNNITVVSNTGSVMFGGAGDTNWRIGRSTGSFTKSFYTNNTLDFIAANSNLEGIAFGFTGSSVYLETGYNGTYTKNPVYVGTINSTSNGIVLSTTSLTVGNSSVNATINSTSFSGTANNATNAFGKTESNLNVNNALTANNTTNLGGTAAASYVQNTDTRTLSGNLIFSGANVVFSGRARFSGGVVANNSLGTAGQILASNGTSVYWTSDQGANAVTANSLSANFISVSTGTITVGNSTVNTDIGNNYVSVGNSSGFVNVYSSYIYIGNSSANATVNSTIYTGTANNANNLGGVAAASYVQNTDSRTLSGNLNFTGANLTVTANLTIASTGELIITSGAGIYANGSLGTANQVLTTNGTTVYWANSSGGGGFTNGQSISVNNFVITGAFTANNSNGTSTQVLSSNGTGAYWSSVSVIDVYYSNGTLAFQGSGSVATYGNMSANSQLYTGNGSNTVYTLATSISDPDNILVILDGLVQAPNTDYTVSGTTLTFTSAPTNNTAIEVRYLTSTVSAGKAIAMAMIFGG